MRRKHQQRIERRNNSSNKNKRMKIENVKLFLAIHSQLFTPNWH